MNREDKYITHIDFRTCDRENSDHIRYNKPDEPMTHDEALEYIRHWALDLITGLTINQITTSYFTFKNQTIKQDGLPREKENC